MKAVLLSIKPKYCELIASGKKTIEVRKSKPKLALPFKVYIYESKFFLPNTRYSAKTWARSGKVIGEFVCDDIEADVSINFDKGYFEYNARTAKVLYEGALSPRKLLNYLNGKEGYGWHISNLRIYDKPKELSEFGKACPKPDYCSKCGWRVTCNNQCGNPELVIKRPPQSWCYVEVSEGI